MDKFPIDEAQIVALFMEAVAYGIYLVTLGLCVKALFWGSTGQKDRYNWPLVAVAGLMCVFATSDLAFRLLHNLDAFIFYKGPGGPDVEFEDISYWVNVMKVGVFLLSVNAVINGLSPDSRHTNDDSHR
jgi:hypothetical protein